MSINRIYQVQERIRDRGLSGVVLFYSRDVYYYTGTAQPAYLVILPNDFKLFIRSGLEFARRESWFPEERIVHERRFEGAAQSMFRGDGQGEKVGVELDLLTIPEARRFQKSLGPRELVDFSSDILDQRAIKSSGEIDAIREACAAAHAGHLAAAEAIRPGVTELEASVCVENAQRLAGHEGIFFMRQPDFVMGRGPLASGPNLQEISGLVFSITGRGSSPAVAAGASRRVMQEGDLVLIDIPPCVRGYHADQSRMYCAGRPSTRALDLHDGLRATADHVIENLRPGLTCDDVFTIAADKVADLGLEEYFMRFPTGIRAHFVGHGLGLELNEPPLLAKGRGDVLRSGMVLALEMHLMEPGGITVKLEDTTWLDDTGCRLLTISPRELTGVNGG